MLPNWDKGERLARSFTISGPALGFAQVEPEGHLTLGVFNCYIKEFGHATQWLHNLPFDPKNQVMGGDSGTEVQVQAVEGDFCLDVMQVDVGRCAERSGGAP